MELKHPQLAVIVVIKSTSVTAVTFCIITVVYSVEYGLCVKLLRKLSPAFKTSFTIQPDAYLLDFEYAHSNCCLCYHSTRGHTSTDITPAIYTTTHPSPFFEPASSSSYIA